MAILIVGSEGFIGKHLVDHFRATGQQVVEADIRPLQKDNYLQVNPYDPDYDEIFSNNSIALCINASGSANVKFSFAQPKIDFDSNTITVFRLLNAIKQHHPGCRFINLSSAAVYGNSSSRPLSEDTPCRPVSPYGYHKWYAELICREFADMFGLKTCSARLFSVYGEGQEKLLFWDMWTKYQQNRAGIELFGSGEEARDFMYVKDVARALQIVFERSSFNGEAINVATGEVTPIKNVARLFFGKIDASTGFSFTHAVKQGDPDVLAADNSELASFGFTCTYALDQGLENYIQWLQGRK
jgi:dTDP-glucose 4,6-dehydratase/UDP-glucose 4-epimerase